MTLLGDSTLEDGFRGRQFLDAAAEYPDRGEPVRAVVHDQRSWLFNVLCDRSTDMGHAGLDPGRVAASSSCSTTARSSRRTRQRQSCPGNIPLPRRRLNSLANAQVSWGRMLP
ncbi:MULTISPECIES: hypothetical protein [unclassified Streptomyces]|uniref:hypothetical protein n=1 Tax=unclassified Streptomyces TaxID=2593676 RepID=UPI002966A158|nr:hypothetical protein [Streptomyces sp. SJL17-1]